MGVLFVPGEPLIHKWLWANRPFGGFKGMQVYRSMADEPFESTWAVEPPAQHPPFSGTAYLSRWAPGAHLADRRYWLQYTEWELYPGLSRFRGIPELLVRLADRDAKQS